jgi:acyl dehydratase
MALNPAALGKPIGPFRKAYDWHDLALYALGVGAGYADLSYCYEKDLTGIPTFLAAAVMEFFWEAGRRASVDPAGVVHGEHALVLHRPLPVEGVLTTEGRITGMFDKGAAKGALVVAESETRHDRRGLLATNTVTIFARLDGGFGGRDRTGAPPRIPGGDPDFRIEETPAENQPLLYRLSGDTFPLHADPDFASMAGFERPIMHGLCTLGFACRALMRALTAGDPRRVRRIACRFSKPLYPGLPIETRIWRIASGRACWSTLGLLDGGEVIRHGVFDFDPS